MSLSPSFSIAQLASPGVFVRLTDLVIPWLVAICLVTLAVGLYGAFSAPEDYQQGEAVRIMYIHVPSAILSTAIYGLMAFAALGVLIWRHPLADVAMRSAAPIGAVFTFITLATGAIWGYPIWGSWWEWDARLTSVLILFLMYLGLIVWWKSVDDPVETARPSAVFVLIGVINIPIIKFSVEWWNSLHQKSSIFRLDGPAIHPSMLWPLMVMIIAFVLLFACLHILAMRNELTRQRIRTLQRLQSRRAN